MSSPCHFLPIIGIHSLVSWIFLPCCVPDAILISRSPRSGKRTFLLTQSTASAGLIFTVL